MFRKSVLRNGKIPANTECPWKDTCKPAKNLTCRHYGINKLRDFNCPHAVANEVIDAVAGVAPVDPVPVKRKTYEYCVMAQPETISQLELRRLLNNKGALGWELCEKEYGFFIFKREVV